MATEKNRSHGVRKSDGGTGRSPSLDRVAEYKKPLHERNWHGASTQANIEDWVDRARQHAQPGAHTMAKPQHCQSPEAGLSPPKGSARDQHLPKLQSTSAEPKAAGGYMPGVRRV
ncbi:MAG TPA: hypothetical protein VIY51_20710 [Xanthobacteraceae bacterium]